MSLRWHGFFFSCYDDPEFTEAMRQDIVENFGEDHANQEYPRCVDGLTRVSTKKGMVFIKDAEKGGHVLDKINSGIAEVYEIETSLGYSVILTPEHKIMTPSGDWDSLDGQLTKNKYISLLPPIFAKDVFELETEVFPIISTQRILITANFARLLGYYMGDGSFYNHTIEFACNSDEDTICDISQLIRDYFGKEPRRKETGKKQGNSFSIALTNKKLKELLKILGCIQQKGNENRWKRYVCVPECIWRSPKEVVREFLRGLFEADGYNGYKIPRVVLFSKYRRFLKEVQILLLGFGITSRLVSIEKIAGNGQIYTGNELQLRKNESILFNKKIGFVSKRKRERIETCNLKSHPNDTIIEMKDWIKG